MLVKHTDAHSLLHQKLTPFTEYLHVSEHWLLEAIAFFLQGDQARALARFDGTAYGCPHDFALRNGLKGWKRHQTWQVLVAFVMLLFHHWSHPGKLIQFKAPLGRELRQIFYLGHVFLGLRCLCCLLRITSSTLRLSQLARTRVLTLKCQPILVRSNWNRLNQRLLLHLSTLPDFVCCKRECQIDTLLLHLVSWRMLEKFTLQL